MLRFILLVLAVTSIPAAAAEKAPRPNNVGAYEAAKGSEAVRTYLFAAGQAYVYSNATIEGRKLPPLFCLPKGLSLNPENYIEIFENALPKARKIFGIAVANVTLEVILLDGLMTTFPCK
jgi:hypothetical protein